MNEKKVYVISLGGSLIAPPEGIDWKFLKDFRKLIVSETKIGNRFFIIAGGGITCRNYIAAADKVVKVSDEDRDWLGIHSTRLNAHLLRTIFYDIAHPEIIKNPTVHMKGKEKIFIAGGWKPGWSTDYVATVLAREYKIKTVINLSNIDYVYTSDPRKNKDAEPIKEINWKNFRKIVGNKWDPGLNAPFDPVASRLAEKLDLEVIIVNGKNVGNFRNFLKGNGSIGTIIKK
ncbi:MAG: UMP kinase [Patescibacteria group bacterium]|jgi:uridylate kinase